MMHLERRCAPVCPAAAAALALEELDRMRARGADFDLLAGVAGAYLNERGIVGGCNE